MQTLINFLNAASPFIIAVTGLLVVLQHFQVKKIQSQTNGLTKIISDFSQEKGRMEEHTAAKQGKTTVGTPVK